MTAPLNGQQFFQMQFPGMEKTSLKPWQQSPQSWAQRPDVQFHGTLREPDWSGPLTNTFGEAPAYDWGSEHGVHLGTYKAAEDRLAERMRQDYSGYGTDGNGLYVAALPEVHARRVPNKVLDPAMGTDPMDVGLPDDVDSWDYDYDEEAEARRQESGYAGYRYVNEFEHAGSTSVHVAANATRSWQDDVLRHRGKAHPSLVDAAERNPPPVEEWLDASAGGGHRRVRPYDVPTTVTPYGVV